MEKKAKALLAAIKKDDLAAFKKLLDKDTEKYSFGRFPILSLCYLYNSRKIAFSYENRLISLSRYTEVEEDRESYLKFRQAARRVLRLYVGGRTVSPLVMLAVTGRHDALRALFPAAYKDAAIRSEIAFTEQSLYQSPVSYGANSIRIRKKKLTRAQFTTALAAACLALVMIAGCLTGYFLLPKDKGTVDAPVSISNGNQLLLALEREGFFALSSDMQVDGDKQKSVFSGTLDGKGKTLRFSNRTSPLIDELTGTIKNLTIEIDVGNATFEDSTSFFVGKNSGEISNVKIVVKGSAFIKDKEHAENEDVSLYLSFLCGENSGAISSCESVCAFSATNEATRNAYISAMVYKNTGSILGCKTSGTLTTDTVDLTGIVINNEENATVDSCECSATLSQSTAKLGWTPNVSGVCQKNLGKISSCLFSGSISGGSTIPKETDSEENKAHYEGVYLGGVSIENGGTLSTCSSTGKITASSDYAAVYVGGCSAFNYGAMNENAFSGEIGVDGNFYSARVGGLIGENTYSTTSIGNQTGGKTEGKITVSASDSGQVLVGGCAGVNDGAYIQGGEYKTAIVSLTGETLAGGVCGINIVEDETYSSQLLFYNHVGLYSTKSASSIRIGDNSFAGGVSGFTSVYLQQCTADSTLEIGNDSTAGGIVAISNYYLMNATSTCTVTAGNGCVVGGLVGTNRSLIQNCTSTSTVAVGDESTVGGAAAVSTSTVTSDVVTLTCTAGKKSTVGGAVGTNKYRVETCKITANVTAGDESVVGGIVGVNLSENANLTALINRNTTVGTYNSLVAGKLTAGKDSAIGGVAGSNERSSIGRCFSSAEKTSGENSVVGGIVGKSDLASVDYTATYKEKFQEEYAAQLQKQQDPDAVVEMYFTSYATFFKNVFVGATSENAFGSIADYTGDGTELNLQATKYASEAEMKNSSEYKEVFGDETKQNNDSVSGGNGADGSL